MKILFAVSNDKISDQIIKNYQKDYKEILSYKNVYYFNAILKELQKDKTYDRVVISEDLEPFSNNNYDTIDKFLFDKLDNISDEATNTMGDDIPIIFICSDRRTQSDEMLVKLFGIGIYSAIIGQDRSIDEVCRLILKPRTKKEAKQYYRIESEDVNYQSENENNVSETEIQNIIAHYKRLGKNTDRYVESFNNIVSQYNDNQLKLIIKFLPLSVKAVLEEESSKYQELVSFDKGKRDTKYKPRSLDSQKQKEESGLKINMLDNVSNKNKVSNIIIPSNVNVSQVKKVIKQPKIEEEPVVEDILDIEPEQEAPKRGRGRPKKIVETEETEKPKRGRGRPKKVVEIEEIEEDVDLFGLDDIKPVVEKKQDDEIDLFALDVEEEKTQEDIDLFDLGSEEEKEEDVNLFDLDEVKEPNLSDIEKTEDFEIKNPNFNLSQIKNQTFENNSLDSVLSKDKKIVSFVGTTKNGTSFIVNNLAMVLSQMGISTAILDMTKSRNAYYIFTKNEENLRKQAYNSIDKLRSGIADGIKVNKSLSVYTALPGEDKDFSDIENILSTLAKNYSVVLVDCDFDTPCDYFKYSQEIYLVQSMDILTIQPLTAFLRNLKSKNCLDESKLRIIINKYQKVRGLSEKTIIGGMAFYNDPSMSFMTELFNRENIKYITVLFENQNYIKYLEALVNCEININGYTKELMSSLKQLADIVYPLVNAKYVPNNYSNNFSANINNTLNQMKKKY